MATLLQWFLEFVYGFREKQANYYENMQNQLSKEELPYLFWTLFDFDEVPNSVVGRLPWRKERQKYFGVIAVDGKENPPINIWIHPDQNERRAVNHTALPST